jgi:hypothetical protein
MIDCDSKKLRGGGTEATQVAGPLTHVCKNQSHFSIAIYPPYR